MSYIGNVEIMNWCKTAYLCSRKHPSGVVLKSYDWATKMRDEGKCVISGFQSRIERDVLKYLLKGKQPIIIVLARGMKTRWEDGIRESINQDRLLILSPFDTTVKRVTEETALVRNKLMLMLADDYYIPYYTQNGVIEKALIETNIKTKIKNI